MLTIFVPPRFQESCKPARAALLRARVAINLCPALPHFCGAAQRQSFKILKELSLEVCGLRETLPEALSRNKSPVAGAVFPRGSYLDAGHELWIQPVDPANHVGGIFYTKPLRIPQVLG